MSDESLWSDHRDDVAAGPFTRLPPGLVSGLAAMASLQESDHVAAPEPDPVDERCWACMKKSGKVEGGKVPLCLRHYVKLRLRYPSRLLDEDPEKRR